MKGIVKLISAMFAAQAVGNPLPPEIGMTGHELARHQSMLIVNGYAGPMPRNMPNQRQRRKQWRQSPSARPKSNRK